MEKTPLIEILGWILTILFLVGLIVAVLGFVVIYDSKRAEGFSGCALSSCPQSLQKWHRQQGGLLYYSKYEQGSKEYWQSYCNGVLNTDFECK